MHAGSRRCRRDRAANRISAERTAGKGPSPEEQLLARERRVVLTRALAKLPERQRSVFMLSHYEGCTSREVSAMTGLNESTVRVHLFRAIRKLRVLLAETTGAGEPWRNAVSILNRLRLNSHLDDAAIAAIWTDSTLEGSRPAHPHLGVLHRVPDALQPVLGMASTNFATTRRAHADELFPAERLAAQHAPDLPPDSKPPNARPASSRFRASAQPLTSRSSHASRWIAAAAAAGLIVGVGVGQVMDLRHIGTASPAHVQARLSAPPQPAGDRVTPAAVNTSGGEDEAFLSDVDASLSRPSVPELRAHRRTDAARRRHATVAVATSQPLIFRKGLDMKEAVAGELATAYHSAHCRPRTGERFQVPSRAADDPSRPRIRVLLRRRSRRRLRLPGAAPVPRAATSSSPAKSSTIRTSTTGCAPRASAFSPIPSRAAICSGRTTSSSCRRSASPSPTWRSSRIRAAPSSTRRAARC